MTIHELFEAQVERTPDAPAVVSNDDQLSYAELNRRANRVGHRLRQLGVGPEVLVTICVDRSLDAVTGLLGILKAGGAYVPLDPAYPSARLAYMVRDAAAPVLLTDRKAADLPSLHSQQVLFFEEAVFHEGSQNSENLKTRVNPDNLAYVIYTSGSTGRPKGVQIAHRAVVNLLSSLRQRPGLSLHDVQVVVASFSFDLSVSSIFLPLSVGARAVIVSEEVAADGVAFSRLLDRVGATAMEATPATWRLLLDAGWSGRASLKIISAGDALPRTLANRLLSRGQALWSLYGPTEATVTTTVYRVEPGNDPVYLGEPIENAEIHLLDTNWRPVRDGETGQLYIGGPGLARGYLGLPELTAKKFIRVPVEGNSETRLYASGDLARRHPDGAIEFLDRIDHQVKIRGFRIELGEVELALAAHPSVQAAVVKVWSDAFGEKRLVAYVTPARGTTVTAEHLRTFLTVKLPAYMMPSDFVFLVEMPLTPNGKVDRERLPEPSRARSDRDKPYAPPRDQTEQLLATIWSEVLGVDRVGADDELADLGGHSLQAARIIARVRDEFGIELPITSFYSSPTIAGLAHLVGSGKAKPKANLGTEIPKRPRVDLLPLSFSQERVWFIHQLAPRNRAYHFQSTITFTGPLDIPSLERSLSEIVRRHEVYRTTFHVAEGAPAQKVHDPWRVVLPLKDLGHLSGEEGKKVAEELLSEECDRPFELSQLPLVRWSLIRTDDEKHILVHVEHHLVHDGWSFRVFVRELLQLYKTFSSGLPSPMPDSPIQMADYAIWERQWAESEDAAQKLEYWTTALQDCPASLELPLDRPRPAVPSFQGASFRMELPSRLCRFIRVLCRQQKATLYSLLLTAFGTLLHRYTSQDVVLVGCAVANRRSRQLEELLGMVVANVVVRCQVLGEATFLDVLERTQKVLLEAQEHSLAPFDRVVAALGRERDLSRNPLFQVMFNMHDAPLPSVEIPGLAVELLEVLPNQASKFDLDVIVIPGSTQLSGSKPGPEEEGITLVWEYSTDLFDDPTIGRMARNYEALLESIVADPNRRIDDLPFLSEVERQQLLLAWNDTAREYPQACIHELFEARVRELPNTRALVCRGSHLSYAELNGKANKLAHYLRKRGVGPGSLVGICLERSADLIVGLMAILKTGAAYLPLDPAYPPERQQFLLSDSDVSVLLTQGRWRNAFSNTKVDLIFVDAERILITRESDENPPSRVRPDGPAYVIYTSGSTGRPNGVCIEHGATVNLLHWARDVFGPEQLALVVAGSSVCFDLSVFEIFAPLAWGGAVLLVEDPKVLADLPPDAEPTLINTVPAAMELLELERLPKSIRVINLAGEPLSPSLVQRVYEKTKAEKVFDLYGPTECTTYSTFALRTPHSPAIIGRPIANTQVYVLDGKQRPVPVGMPGELYLGGAGLARGYWQRPDLTQEKFIPNPFSQVPEARLYRTGDQVRFRSDGNLEFLGRRDNQVKILGIRIEPGEVEAALTEHSAVRAAVVVDREYEHGEKRLIAYVVFRGDPSSVDDLRRFLQRKLPRYMLPLEYEVLEALPLTSNGKVDRRALPPPEEPRPAAEVDHSFTHPDLERQLSDIWEKVLAVAPIAKTDNFFELGGDSIDAIRVLNRIETIFGKRVGIRQIFDSPTIGQLARLLDELM
jgi:amino acid adenylation domain-containing protein